MESQMEMLKCEIRTIEASHKSVIEIKNGQYLGKCEEMAKIEKLAVNLKHESFFFIPLHGPYAYTKQTFIGCFGGPSL